MPSRWLVVVLALLSIPASARDWFVRAGSSGTGTRAAPFGDPWEALDACEAGDRIHVAGGKYYGRIDGFVIDMDSQNEHDSDGALDPRFHEPTPLVIDQPGFVVANNLILNASSEAMHIRPGVTVENNLIVNSVGYGIWVTSGTTLR